MKKNKETKAEFTSISEFVIFMLEGPTILMDTVISVWEFYFWDYKWRD